MVCEAIDKPKPRLGASPGTSLGTRQLFKHLPMWASAAVGATERLCISRLGAVRKLRKRSLGPIAASTWVQGSVKTPRRGHIVRRCRRQRYLEGTFAASCVLRLDSGGDRNLKGQVCRAVLCNDLPMQKSDNMTRFRSFLADRLHLLYFAFRTWIVLSLVEVDHHGTRRRHSRVRVALVRY